MMTKGSSHLRLTGLLSSQVAVQGTAEYSWVALCLHYQSLNLVVFGVWLSEARLYYCVSQRDVVSTCHLEL